MGLFSKREKADGFSSGGSGVTVLTGGAAAFVPGTPGAPGGRTAGTLVPRASQVRADEIATVDDLPEFVRILYDELDMAPSLRHVICPVLVETAASAEGRGRFALIHTRDMANSDVTEEILRQLRLRFDPATPVMHLAAAQVMVALSRGSVERLVAATGWPSVRVAARPARCGRTSMRSAASRCARGRPICTGRSKTRVAIRRCVWRSTATWSRRPNSAWRRG